MDISKTLPFFGVFSLLTFFSWNYCGFLIIGCIIVVIHVLSIFRNSKLGVFFLVCWAFSLLFNICATFWLFVSDPLKSLLVFFVNSLFLASILFLLSIISRRINSLSVFLFWPFSEWLFTQWDIAWPWLILGNSLGNCWTFVGWYTYVGVYGGSLWLILISWSIYKNFTTGKYCIITALLCIPCCYSYYNFYNKSEQDPVAEQDFIIYNPRNSGKDIVQQNTHFLFTVKQLPDSSSIVITPELYVSTAYQKLNNAEFSFFTDEYFKRFPKSKLLLGLEITDHENRFNTVTLFEKNKMLVKTKKKYVPITEHTPSLLEPLFGKSFYSKNTEDDSYLVRKRVGTLPLVCYEILFSDFVAQYTIDSKYMILMSSEDFMNDSYYGKQQYLNQVRLRAIENGRYLIKNSYHGISCVIKPNGAVLQIFKDEYTPTKIPIITKNTIYQKLVSHIFLIN